MRRSARSGRRTNQEWRNGRLVELPKTPQRTCNQPNRAVLFDAAARTHARTHAHWANYCICDIAFSLSLSRTEPQSLSVLCMEVIGENDQVYRAAVRVLPIELRQRLESYRRNHRTPCEDESDESLCSSSSSSSMTLSNGGDAEARPSARAIFSGLGSLLTERMSAFFEDLIDEPDEVPDDDITEAMHVPTLS